MQELKLSIIHLRGKAVKVVAKTGRQRLIDLQLSGDTWVGRALPRMSGRDCVELVGVLNHMIRCGWVVEVGPANAERKVPVRLTSPDADPLVIEPEPMEWRCLGSLLKSVMYVLTSRRGLVPDAN